MTILSEEGDLIASRAHYLVCPVNTVGVMGAGLAKKFAGAYPDYERSYRRACTSGELKIGVLHVYTTLRFQSIVSFPTKQHWKAPSRMEYIEEGLAALVDWASKDKWYSVAVPALGCGLGGLDWVEVRLMMDKFFSRVPDTLWFLYSPQ